MRLGLLVPLLLLLQLSRSLHQKHTSTFGWNSYCTFGATPQLESTCHILEPDVPASD